MTSYEAKKVARLIWCTNR